MSGIIQTTAGCLCGFAGLPERYQGFAGRKDAPSSIPTALSGPDARAILSSWMAANHYMRGSANTIEELLAELKEQLSAERLGHLEKIQHLEKTVEWHDIFAWMNCLDQKDAKEQAACFMHTTLSGLLRGSEGQVEKALTDQLLAAELRATRKEHAEPVRLRETVASWMLSQGYATGHGDTIEDLLGELGGQIEPFRDGIIKIATFIEPHWLGANSVTDAYDPAKVLKIVVECVTSLSADTERMDETIARMQADIARKDEALKEAFGFITNLEAIKSPRRSYQFIGLFAETIKEKIAALLPKSSPNGEGRV